MATRTGKRTKAGRRGKKAARGGAAAFAVGLFLAGPQAVAGADTGSDGSAATESGQASSAAQAPARAGVTRSKAAGARTGSPAAEGAGRGAVGRGSAPARTVAPAAGVRAARSGAAVQGPHAAAAEQPGRIARTGPNGAAVTVPAVPVPSTPVVSTLARSAAVVRAAVLESGPVSAAAAAPPSARSVPTASAVALPSPAAVQDMIDGGVRAAFNAAEHWLFGLSDSPLKGAVEGALLLLRRTFFNHAPRLTPSQQSTSEAGIIQGRLGAYDHEGDTLTYTVVDNPQLGTVVLGPDGSYAYTPGQDFAGTDTFTVKIAPAKRSLNVLNLGSDGSRVATIQIGAENFIDAADVAVYLPEASGHLKVTKNLFNQFTGTVTLSDVTPDTVLRWMDLSGRLGSVSLEDLATNHWPEFKAKAADNGATINLTIAYTDAAGVKNVVKLDNVDITKKGGEYVLTGGLAPNHKLDPQGVDRWDVVGKHLKEPYENFLTTYNIGTGGKSKFTTVDIDFTGASVYADTLTPLSYQKVGAYASDSEARQEPTTATPGSSDPAPPLLLGSTSASTTSSSSAQTAVSTNRPVTASAAFGQSVVIGRDDGSVEVWTDGTMKVLKGAGWAQVDTILEYTLPLVDDDGKPLASTFTGYIQGTTLTVTSTGLGSTVVVGSEITGAGIAPGTVITKFVPQTASCTATSGATCTATSGTGAGGLDGSTGTYEVSIAQTVGGQTATPTGDSNGSFTPAGISITQKNVSAGSPVVVVGLADGAVELFSVDTGWVELHDSGWGASVTSMIPYGAGLVVGLDNGSVQLWNGPVSSDPDSAQDPARWKFNWLELQNDGWKQEVTALVAYQKGFLVGLGGPLIQNSQDQYPGGVQYWDGSGWTEVHDTSWGWLGGVSKMIAYKDGVVVGLNDGRVEQWTGTARPSQYSTLAASTWIPTWPAGSALSPGGALTSPNGVYTLRLQSDGNLVLYGGGKALWNTQSAGKGANKLIMQSDGNLVLYNYGGSPVWATNTNGKGAVTMSVNDDGNVVLYKADGTAVWASQTSDQHGASGTYKEPSPRPSPFANNWTQLSTGWKSEVTALMPYKGQPQICSGGCDGFLVGLANGAVFQFNEARNGANLPGWYDLQGTGWASGVTTLVPFDRDAYGLPLFMVGLDNGAVQKWNGSKFIEVHGSSWDSAVTAMIAVQNSETNSNNDPVIVDNVYVGLANGDIKEWTDTAQRPSDKDSLGVNAYLGAGIAGAQGNALTSPNGSYSLFLQDDGNVVLYGGGDALWSTKTEGKGGNKLLMQDDGNLVLYKYDQENDTSTVVWSTDTASTFNWDTHYLRLGDDGNLVVYLELTETNKVLGPVTGVKASWASGFDPYLDSNIGCVSTAGTCTGGNGTQDVAKGGVNGASGNYTPPATPPAPIANNWITLSGVENVAREILSRKEAFTCDSSKWKCYTPGAVYDATLFGTKLAAGAGGFALPEWGTPGGIGSSDDPIFGDPRIAALAAVSGSYLAFAVQKPVFVPLATACQSGSQEACVANFEGYIEAGFGPAPTDGGQLPPATSILHVLLSDVVIKPGMQITASLLGANLMQPATVVGPVEGQSNQWYLSGTPQTVYATEFTATQTPNAQLGVDIVSPTVYGYLYYPDGLFPKFHVGNYSIGLFFNALAGGEVRANLNAAGGIGANGSISGPRTVQPGAITDGLEVPVDYIGYQSSLKWQVAATLPALAGKPSLSAYARANLGTLITFNTASAPGHWRGAANTGWDVSANDFLQVWNSLNVLDGDFEIELSGTVTPNLSAYYKISTPPISKDSTKLAGFLSGWEFLELSAGIEMPITVKQCISAGKKNCPAKDPDSFGITIGASTDLAKFDGVVNNGTFGDSSIGRTVPNANLGNTLTVTNSSLLGNTLPGDAAVGWVVSGPGIPFGTTITKYKGQVYIEPISSGIGRVQYDQYELSNSFLSVGGGYFGTFPTMSAWKPGGVAATMIDAGLNFTYTAAFLPGIYSGLTKKGVLPIADYGFYIAETQT
jgi:hypothetical protein